MDAYAVLRFIHVLLAITAVGTNITYGFWLAHAARQPAHLAHVLNGVKFLDDRIANPAYGLLLVTGLAMLYFGRLSWTTPWILASLVLYAGVIALGLLVYTPLLRRQIETLETAGVESAAYAKVANRARLVGILFAVPIAVIVFLMVTKPALW